MVGLSSVSLGIWRSVIDSENMALAVCVCVCGGGGGRGAGGKLVVCMNIRMFLAGQ